MSDPLIIDLPFPPSVNRFTSRLGNNSPVVQKWWMSADGAIIHEMRVIRRKAVKGPFVLHVVLTEKKWKSCDADNRLKPLLDYLQRIEVIDNDKNLWFLSVGWGEAPLGCRVQIRPKEHADGKRERWLTGLMT